MRKLTLFLLATLLLGALLAPPLYFLGQWLVTHAKDSAWGQWGLVKALVEEAQKAPFTRYFNRAVLVAGLVLLWPFARWLNLGGWRGLGLEPDTHWLRRLLLGFGVASAGLLLMGVAYASWRWVLWRQPLPLETVWTALFTGVCVAVLEETLFRGLILGLLLRTTTFWRAQGFTAAFYSLVHFLKPPENLEFASHEIGPWSGLSVLGSIAGHFWKMDTLLAEFLTLLAVGAVLGHMRWQTRSLWLPIGLHAGWVFALKWFAALSKNSKPLQAGALLPWAGENVKVGLLPLAIILVSWALLAICMRVQKPKYLSMAGPEMRDMPG